MEKDLDALGQRLHARLVAEANLDQLTGLLLPQRRAMVERLVSQMLLQERAVLSKQDRDTLLQRLVDDTVGYGPIEALMRNPDITEIMVVRPDEIYFEQSGRLSQAEIRFRDEAHVLTVIQRIVGSIGRRVDEASPMVDARLSDGSRVNVVLPPVALFGPTITIRRFRQKPYLLDDLVGLGAMPQEISEYLAEQILRRRNFLISGGTGSGKTTLLGAIAALIPPSERVVTIEDMAELRLPRPHVVALEGRPANVEGKGEITIRQLVKNALRMRPDRIIVGEVRGNEALDMLQAMNTGHEGSLTTIHANSAEEAFGRLEAMVIMAGTVLPLAVIREHLVSALDVVVQVGRLASGERKVLQVVEVDGVADGHVQVKEIFRREGCA